MCEIVFSFFGVLLVVLGTQGIREGKNENPINNLGGTPRIGSGRNV